jgi:hypothetical protein
MVVQRSSKPKLSLAFIIIRNFYFHLCHFGNMLCSIVRLNIKIEPKSRKLRLIDFCNGVLVIENSKWRPNLKWASKRFQLFQLLCCSQTSNKLKIHHKEFCVLSVLHI